MQNTRPPRNESLNLLKFLSCITVVFLHCRFPGKFGEMVIYAFRFSVPVFFMVSGYFSFRKTPDWMAGKIRQTLHYILLLEVFYGIWEQIRICLIGGASLTLFAARLPSGWELLKDLLFGSFFNGTLWYLYAALWTWVIFRLLAKHGLLGKAVFSVPVLLLVHILGRFWLQNHGDISRYVFLFRSALLFGLPFQLTGYAIAEKEALLKEKCSLPACLILILFGHGLIVAEYLLAGQYMDLHISSVVISFGLFLTAVLRPQFRGLKLLRFVGDKLSMWIYYLHVFVMSVLSVLSTGLRMNANPVFLWLQPLLVFLLAAVLSWLIFLAKQKKR